MKPVSSGQRSLDRLGMCVQGICGKVKGLAREKVTRGWWVQLKMEPRIRILRRERVEGLDELYENWDAISHRHRH